MIGARAAPRGGSIRVSSKAIARFQSLTRRVAPIAAMAGLAVMVGAQARMPDGRPTPTGLEVPRWVSLKSSEVRARRGPGLDYDILWEYRSAGLPVQVVAETREWRKVCDPQGSIAWIHRSVASGRRSVFNTTTAQIAVHASRSATSPVRARIAPRSLVPLDDCDDGWCRVRAGKTRGWVPQGTVFGTQTRPLCDPARPAGRAG